MLRFNGTRVSAERHTGARSYNYDLPCSPNRLNQCSGRPHCICQTDVFHLGNLVAEGAHKREVRNAAA